VSLCTRTAVFGHGYQGLGSKLDLGEKMWEMLVRIVSTNARISGSVWAVTSSPSAGHGGPRSHLGKCHRHTKKGGSLTLK